MEDERTATMEISFPDFWDQSKNSDFKNLVTKYENIWNTRGMQQTTASLKSLSLKSKFNN